MFEKISQSLPALETRDRQSKKATERSYYLTAESAVEFDRRSGLTSNLKRYNGISEKICRILDSGVLLDVGCGTARMLIEIAKAIPELKLVGIDVSEAMIDIGTGNVSRAGLSERIELKKCSAEDLGIFPDRCFDVVVSCGCFSAWVEPAETLGQIHRILKKGGRALIYDWNRKAPFYRKGRLLIEAVHDKSLRKRIRMAFKAAYTQKEVRQLITASPFRLEAPQTEGHWMTWILTKRPNYG